MARSASALSNPTMNRSELKVALIGHLRSRHTDICRHWFDNIEPSVVQDGVLRLVVQEPVQLKYLQRCCIEPFTEAAQAVTGHLVVVRFVSPAEDQQLTATGRGVPVARPVISSSDGNELPSWLDEQMVISPDYTFDSFVIGPGNRLAHAAAGAVVQNPGRAYNPFFVHGGVGLGKTHLLQSICQELLRKNPQMRLCYISCNTFMDLFHESVKAGRMPDFRNRFRTCDCLVIDDIHFLSKHEQTQEEFFHTFNALSQLGRQIVLSSDAQPDEIPSLERRLTSRFLAGLVARIDRPTFETRVAIVKAKAALHQLALPDDVPAYVAAKIDSNIRELEGALTRIRGLAMANRAPITLELAKLALEDEPTRASSSTPTLQTIIEVVARYYGVRPIDILSTRRTKSIVLPRHVAMFLARKHTRFSLEEVGGYFGGRDHTTVMHAVQTIRDRLEQEEPLASDSQRIEKELERRALGDTAEN